MRLLALDAATEACSVALLRDTEIIERAVESGKSHAPQLLAMVRELLAEAQLSLAQLDGIAAGIGPGAFTGVRIGVSVAQGLAFGADLPVVAVNTLEALALQALGAAAAPAPMERVLACLDARMQEVYWACYRSDAAELLSATTAAAVSAPAAVRVPQDLPHAGIGRGFAAYPALGMLAGVEVSAAAARAVPRAREFARLGSLRLRQGGGMDPAQLQPLYIRDKVAFTAAEQQARRGTPNSS